MEAARKTELCQGVGMVADALVQGGGNECEARRVQKK